MTKVREKKTTRKMGLMDSMKKRWTM